MPRISQDNGASEVNHYVLAYSARILESFPTRDADLVTQFYTARVGAGRKPTTMRNAISCLLRFSNASDLALHELTASSVDRSLVALRKQYTVRSVQQTLAWVRVFVRWYYERVHDAEPPRSLSRALVVQAPQGITRKPITAAEFEALLAAAGEHTDQVRAVMLQALLWLMWDTGFRVHEVCAVRLCDWSVDAAGTGTVGMDPTAPNLKTGPRDVPVVDSVGAISAWVQLRSREVDASARLFPLRAAEIGRVLGRLSEAAKIRHVHAHLFRHSRASRAAVLRWTQAHACRFFGWRPGSSEWSTYAHIYGNDLAAAVRKDADIDPLGKLVRDDPHKAIAEVAAASSSAAVAELMRSVGLGVLEASVRQKRRSGEHQPGLVPV